MTATTFDFNIDDTVTVDGKGRWVVEVIYAPSANAVAAGRRPFVTVSKMTSRGRDHRYTEMDVDPSRVALVRRGNAEIDAANETLAAANLPLIAARG